MKRSIKRAINVKTGIIVNADSIFKTQKEGQLIRKEDKETEGDDYACYECQQPLETSSRNKNVFFRHKKGHAICDLTDLSLTEKEREDFFFMMQLKEESQISFNGKRSSEGERHKYLKMSIAKKIKSVSGVSDVHVEKVLKKEGKIRRPDVYCKFNEKEVVFEIQLSKLSARYMFSRYRFYQQNGIYLIWVLDIEVHEQDQFAIDIKYLNEYQNFFKFNEYSTPFKLNCLYKEVRLNSHDELYSQWQERAISFQQLNFDKKIFQVYYYDYELNINAKKEEQKRRIVEKERKELERLQLEKRKKEEFEENWKRKWHQLFPNEFRKNSDLFIENKLGQTLWFVQPAFPMSQILDVINQYKNVVWIIHSYEIEEDFVIDEIYSKKMEEYKNIERTFDNEIYEAKLKVKDLEFTHDNEIEKLEGEIESIELKIQHKQKRKQEFHDIKSHIWEEIKPDAIENENSIFRSSKELKDEIISFKKRKQNLLEKIEVLENDIEVWQTFKDRTFPNLIVRHKPNHEINESELLKNRTRILAVESRKFLLAKKDESLIIPLTNFSIDEILATKDNYSFYDNYSEKIKDWQKEKNQLEKEINRMGEIQLQLELKIQAEFNIEIEGQIETLINQKTKIISKKEIAIQCFLQQKTKNEEDIKTSQNEMEEIRLFFKNEYQFKYSFFWSDFEPKWGYSNQQIYFDRGEDMLHLCSENCVEVLEYDEFLDKFNV